MIWRWRFDLEQLFDFGQAAGEPFNVRSERIIAAARITMSVEMSESKGSLLTFFGQVLACPARRRRYWRYLDVHRLSTGLGDRTVH